MKSNRVLLRPPIAALVAVALSFAAAAAAAEAKADTLYRVPIQGVTTSAALSMSPQSYNFGNVALGQSAVANFTLTNTSIFDVTGLTVQGSSNFTTSGSCGAALQAGTQCTETVTFTPTAGQAYSGSFTAGNGSASVSASLSAIGLQTSDSVNVGSLNFPNQIVGTTSSGQGVQLTNTGNTPLAVNTITTSGAYSATHNCGSSLAIGGSCGIDVTFTPTAQGNNPGTLSIATAANTQTVTLTGLGLQCTPGNELIQPSSAFATQSQTFDPAVTAPGCTTFTVLVVGYGGSGQYAYPTGGGGSGYVNVWQGNLTSAVTASVNGSTGQACFGSVCAAMGTYSGTTGAGGAGGSGGGTYGNAGGAGGGAGKGTMGGTGQGSFVSQLALFRQRTVSAGAGGVAPNSSVGGGGGGVLISGAAPVSQATYSAGDTASYYTAFGAGGAGELKQCQSGCQTEAFYPSSGVVYIEWSK